MKMGPDIHLKDATLGISIHMHFVSTDARKTLTHYFTDLSRKKVGTWIYCSLYFSDLMLSEVCSQLSSTLFWALAR